MNVSISLRACFSASLMTALFLASVVQAGQVTPGDFTGAAVVQNYELLGNTSNEYATPFIIGNDTYRADDGILVSSSKFGPAIRRSDVAIGNEPEVSHALVGFIDIALGSTVLRAGLYVGFQFPWAADVNFYGGSNALLGTISLSGTGGQSSFAAWQADSGMINRIRVVNSVNPENRLIVDDLITEVPEPRNILLFAIWALWAACSRRRPVSSSKKVLDNPCPPPLYNNSRISEVI